MLNKEKKVYLLFTGAPCCPDLDEMKGVFTDISLLKKAYRELAKAQSADSGSCRFLKPFVYEAVLNGVINDFFTNEEHVKLLDENEIICLADEK